MKWAQDDVFFFSPCLDVTTTKIESLVCPNLLWNSAIVEIYDFDGIPQTQTLLLLYGNTTRKYAQHMDCPQQNPCPLVWVGTEYIVLHPLIWSRLKTMLSVWKTFFSPLCNFKRKTAECFLPFILFLMTYNDYFLLYCSQHNIAYCLSYHVLLYHIYSVDYHIWFHLPWIASKSKVWRHQKHNHDCSCLSATQSSQKKTCFWRIVLQFVLGDYIREFFPVSIGGLNCFDLKLFFECAKI